MGSSANDDAIHKLLLRFLAKRHNLVAEDRNAELRINAAVDVGIGTCEHEALISLHIEFLDAWTGMEERY